MWLLAVAVAGVLLLELFLAVTGDVGPPAEDAESSYRRSRAEHPAGRTRSREVPEEGRRTA